MCGRLQVAAARVCVGVCGCLCAFISLDGCVRVGGRSVWECVCVCVGGEFSGRWWASHHVRGRRK